MPLGKLIGDLLGGTGKEILQGARDIVDEASYSKEERQQALLEWEKLSNEKLVKLTQIALETEAKYLADIDSARAMQKSALSQDDVFSKRFLYYFITGWSVFSMSFLIGVTFYPIPEQAVRFADTILGFLLGTAIASVFSFMVGSNKGSRSKDEAIAGMVKALPKAEND